MCEKCELIDYGVADCWRPCYQPSRKSHLPVPGRIFNQDDFAAQQTIETLRLSLRAAQQEANKLRFEVEHGRVKQPVQIPFEGAEL